MTEPDGAPTSKLPLQTSDLRGLSRLAVDATVGVVDLVEHMHHTIASVSPPAGAPATGPARGVAGLVYRTVRGTTRLVGHGLDLLLAQLPAPAPGQASSPQREAALAALNGVWGDHLADSGNPLAITMALRTDGRALELDRESLARRLPAAGPRVLVLVHGLCMNDTQWLRQGHDHGQALARSCGFTPVYLHYNSGRHVSQNGRDFAALLERLLAAWPVPVDELVIVGHSMGGLVARSACHQAAPDGAWLAALRSLVFLGTPHQGAPLERGGRWIDTLLGVSPYAAPFARLGKARSAGITDLRFGNLQDADWQGRDRHDQHHDDRQPTPLPAGVNAFLVAATTGPGRSGLRSALVGDGLVPLKSALGRHRNPLLALDVPEAHQLVVTQANHWDLLSRPDVAAQLERWLAPPAR